MLDTHTTEHGYTEVYAPVHGEAAPAPTASPARQVQGRNVKIEDRDLYLIPTSEYSVTNFRARRDRAAGEAAAEVRLSFALLPLGGRSRGQGHARHDPQPPVRQVELVQIVHPAKSYEAHEQLTGHAETILKKLELPHRVVTLCTGDTGFSSAKTYDIEVWLPGDNDYREISSCSNFEAFRRGACRARSATRKASRSSLDTLNGSGLAVGRTLIAVMENYQRADGGVDVPPVLQPTWGISRS